MSIDPIQNDQLLKTARMWVSQTFFGEMLKQMRNSPFRTDMTDGGRGGQAFLSQLDQQIAERLSNGSAGERLARSIVRSIQGRSNVKATDRT